MPEPDGWKPGLKLIRDLQDGDHIEVRLPAGVHRGYYVAWLMSDAARKSFEEFEAEHRARKEGRA